MLPRLVGTQSAQVTAQINGRQECTRMRRIIQLHETRRDRGGNFDETRISQTHRSRFGIRVIPGPIPPHKRCQ